MKLSLSSEKNVEILVVQAPIAEHDIQILRAGIQKILKTGKNKIVLELPEMHDLPSEVLRELARFDIVARELSGRIVLAHVSAQLKTKIEVFAKPPVILCFETRLKAIEFLTTPPPPELPTEAARPPEADPRIQEYANLKVLMANLERKNQELEEQIIETTIKRRTPPDEAVYLTKISALEAKIESLVAAAAAAAASGAPAGSAPTAPATK